jgi:hypothetical protein
MPRLYSARRWIGAPDHLFELPHGDKQGADYGTHVAAKRDRLIELELRPPGFEARWHLVGGGIMKTFDRV